MSLIVLIASVIIHHGLNTFVAAMDHRNPICTNVVHGRYVRSHESCQAYNYCANGQAYHGWCSTGYLFNAQAEICENSGLVDCARCSTQGLQNIANPTDCARFFRCASGFRTERICPVGLRFDPRIGDCNFDRNSECQMRQSVCAAFSHLGTVLVGNVNDCTR